VSRASVPARAARAAGARLGLVAILSLIAALLALLAYGLTASSPDDSIDGRLAERRAAEAPALELPVLQQGSLGPLTDELRPALADDRLALDELRGIPVVLNFWASWCPPCRSEAPLLERRWRSLRAQGVVMLGLDMQDLTGDARDFIREFRISYPNVRDQSDDVAIDWGVAALPETFFIDARGRVVGHVIGAVSDPQLRAGISAARSGEPVGARSGGDRRPTR
jgi:cytochrome c biogenesis protein CcmG, thiol:disulfide interchange protein DsbE